MVKTVADLLVNHDAVLAARAAAKETRKLVDMQDELVELHAEFFSH